MDSPSEPQTDDSLFGLTEVPSAISFISYITPETVDEAYNHTLYCIILGQNKIDRNIRIMLEKYQKDIEEIIPILFEDIHNSIFMHETYELTMSKNNTWKIIYNKIYGTTKSRTFFDKFIQIIPFILTFAILSLYESINKQIEAKQAKPTSPRSSPKSQGFSTPKAKKITPKHLLVPIPSRSTICERVVYLFTTIKPLHSYLEETMNRLFGPDETKRPPQEPEKTKKSIKVPIEDTSQLVPLEKRPRVTRVEWGATSRSPMLSRQHPKTSNPLSFIYPPDQEESYRKLPKYTDIKPSSGPYDQEKESKSLLIRARTPDVRANLKKLEARTTLTRTSLMHKYEQEQQMIIQKHEAVCHASPKMKNKFIKQMRKNQKRGIYLEDPKVTLDLLRAENRELEEDHHERISNRDVDAIVGHVLNQAAIKVRQNEETEIHLSEKTRAAIFDPNKVIEE